MLARVLGRVMARVLARVLARILAEPCWDTPIAFMNRLMLRSFHCYLATTQTVFIAVKFGLAESQHLSVEMSCELVHQILSGLYYIHKRAYINAYTYMRHMILFYIWWWVGLYRPSLRYGNL